MKLKKFFLLTVSLIVLTFTLFPEGLDKNVERGFASIQPMDVYGYCKTLASAPYAGRLTGHEGYTEAAKWAAEKFRKWGLKPLSREEGYLQAYPSPYTLIKTAEMTLILKEKEVSLELEKDFLPLIFSDSGDRTAELVFAGWGIQAPGLGYDDYAGIDVKGKFILCFRGTPDPQKKEFEEHDQHRTRMKTAKEKGALGLVYIYSEVGANPNGDWIEGFMPAVISEKAADMVLKERGITSAELKASLVRQKKPDSFPLNSRAHFKVSSHHYPEATGYNVVGYVEGSDPLLKKECLVYGGHFDHCGSHAGLLFPGADDNASGSAVVMEIAEAFTKLKKKPKRSVVFVLFGGEEMGLMGSNYFAEHLPSQFEKVYSMFNFDMVGEGDGTICIFSAEPDGFKTVLEDSDKHVNTLKKTSIIRGVGVRSSDYAPFFLKGAHCASFFSNGPHLHYHMTGDTIYRINPDIMADIARLAFLSGYAWANL